MRNKCHYIQKYLQTRARARRLFNRANLIFKKEQDHNNGLDAFVSSRNRAIFAREKRVAFLEERIVCVSRGRKHERMRRNNEGHRCRSKAQITGDRADWHPSKPSQKGDKPLEAFFLENQWRLLFPINKIQRTTISHCSKSQTNFEIHSISIDILELTLLEIITIILLQSLFHEASLNE